MHHTDIADVLAGVCLVECVAAHVRSFAQELIDYGYTRLSTRDYVLAAAHFGQWLEIRGIAPQEITEAVLVRFRRHHCLCPGAAVHGRCPSRRYVARVRRFVENMHAHGVVEIPEKSPPPVPTPLVAFGQWMSEKRGLTISTINRYELLITKMLPLLGDDPKMYDAKVIRGAFLQHTDGMSRGYARCFVSALRAFLRFLAVEGRCRSYLERAVPTIPQWRLSSLPRYLLPEDVERVIDSCDLDKSCGIRDRAILLLLARLGLRASDIVMMTLDDLDWEAGTVRVRAKNRREVLLPLPQDAGDAILEYLDGVRPATPIARVFLCSNAPVRPFPTCSTVSNIVGLALKRAGIIDPPSWGAHLLRHSAATAMLRAGAGLDLIATVLRHASSDTTAHYAKIDLELLRSVAQPWPEVPNAHR